MSEPAQNMQQEPAASTPVERPNPVSDAERLGAAPASPVFSDGLPPEVSDALNKAGIDSVEALARNWIEAQTMVGGSIRVPTQQAGEEQWGEFYSTLQERVPGLQRMPEGYEPPPEDYTQYSWDQIEGFQETNGSLEQYAKTAHELGLTPQQANGMRKFLADNIIQDVQRSQQATEATIGELKAEWGPAFDHQVALAHGVAKKYLSDKTMDYLDASGKGNDPNLLRMFAEIGKTLSEPQMESVIN
jgi:hypothetical protein